MERPSLIVGCKSSEVMPDSTQTKLKVSCDLGALLNGLSLEVVTL